METLDRLARQVTQTHRAETSWWEALGLITLPQVYTGQWCTSL